MKVQVQGQSQPTTLDKRMFVAAGGEGEIYAKGLTAFKIYSDPNKMMAAGKIQELAVLTDPNIIRPLSLVLDPKNKPIGYTMRFIQHNYALVQLFTKAFRQRNGITHEMMQKLVQKLRDIVQHIHDHDILIVDLNEMNFLSDDNFEQIFAIDTDSYQTPGYPATAIMDSVRDRHAKTFSEETDWFSYGIISFQMFVGIHPYKGKHPSIKDMDERMHKNISVFSRDVKVPHVCFPLDVIPDVYKQWYKAVFEDGKRLPPPANFQATAVVIAPVVKRIAGSNNFEITEMLSLDGNILAIHPHANIRVLTDQRFYITQSRSFPVSHPVRLCVTPVTQTPILVKLEHGKLQLFNAEKKSEIKNHIHGQGLMTYNGSLYVRSGDSITYVDMMEVGQNILVSPKIVASILENATKMFDGVAIQNLLGAQYVSIFSEPTTHRQVHVKELDEYRIIDAKYDNLVLMVVGVKKSGYYDRLVIRFSPDWKTYDVRVVSNVPHLGLNFVVLDSGVVVCINEEEDLEAFSNRIHSTGIRIVNDPIITGDMRLYKYGARLLFSRGERLFSMKMMSST
jgi:serine/threonine protein kinase